MFLFSGSAQLTEKCLALLMHIKEQNDHILTCITQQQRNPAFQVLPELPAKFPLNSINDLLILDTYLIANSQAASGLVSSVFALIFYCKLTSDFQSSYLSSLGGKDITNKTNRILKYIFTDELAKHFNYLGQRSEKRAFSQLTLNEILIGKA